MVNVLEMREIEFGDHPLSEPFNCARSWGVGELKFVLVAHKTAWAVPFTSTLLPTT